MSLAIPAVVTPIGANCEVVQDGINGFWADNDDQWYNTLEQLILHSDRRTEMGKAAQQKIQSQYAVNSTLSQFTDLFKSATNK
jgi:hypothetical protein